MIVSACSNRKKAPIDPSLHAARLTAGYLPDVVKQWRSLLVSAPTPHTAQTLYAGRSFAEAAWAARTAGMPHYIVSAGLGLVGPTMSVPAYALTTVGSTDENVLEKCPPGTTPQDWWRCAFTPGVLTELISASQDRVFLGLPSVYLEMVQHDLVSLSDANLSKVRIFTGGGNTLRGTKLAQNILHYDSRLDGPDSPIPGTKSDFASRALRHFFEFTQQTSGNDLPTDRALVDAALLGMRVPVLPKRERRSDIEIREALIQAWTRAKGNRQILLRHLRDVLLVSCEQSRFARIARELEEERLV